METNRIIDFWKSLAELGIYQQMATDGTPVQCVSMNEVFTGKQMKFLQRAFHPEPKQCFQNCACLVQLLSHPFGKMLGFEADAIKYVDGFAYEPGMIPIEHAFVKVGNLYCDPTFETVLNIDVSKCEYVSLLELKWRDLRRILEKRGFYGPLYGETQNKRIQGKNA